MIHVVTFLLGLLVGIAIAVALFVNRSLTRFKKGGRIGEAATQYQLDLYHHYLCQLLRNCDVSFFTFEQWLEQEDSGVHGFTQPMPSSDLADLVEENTAQVIKAEILRQQKTRGLLEND